MRVPDPDERNGSSSVPSSDLHQLGDGVGMGSLQAQSYCLLLVAGTLKMFIKFDDREGTGVWTHTQGAGHEGLVLVSFQHVVEESLTVRLVAAGVDHLGNSSSEVHCSLNSEASHQSFVGAITVKIFSLDYGY